ncbi:hypothetical protein CAter282_0795 [Collimonas arenae]|uniref:Uncharacterized protein n=1 Tax=Collimonas arenae TaxID=279058 RepID=A0A127PLS0_9BURK|nr:hypothetical protein CAter10_0866 [Collimonas arenae]AMP08598.1 hypothetical protein CAter282_0795 [Collimonas arenae]
MDYPVIFRYTPKNAIGKYDGIYSFPSWCSLLKRDELQALVADNYESAADY